MLLVVGATGLLGSQICRRALRSGRAIRALVRASSNPEKVEQLKRGVASIAVDAASTAAARNRALLVGGPESLTPHKVVQVFNAISLGGTYAGCN